MPLCFPMGSSSQRTGQKPLQVPHSSCFPRNLPCACPPRTFVSYNSLFQKDFRTQSWISSFPVKLSKSCTLFVICFVSNDYWMQTDEDLLCRKLLIPGERMCHYYMSWDEKIFPCTPKIPSVKSRVPGQGEHRAGTFWALLHPSAVPGFSPK